MHIVKREAFFENDISEVWDFITNLNHQNWRSQIDRIEILDHHHFIEYDKEGYQTEFIIVNIVENEVYEFNMKNDNIEGHWIGKLTLMDDGRVRLEMTEAIQVKKKVMNLFAKVYLKKQQEQYIEDLKKALEE